MGIDVSDSCLNPAQQDQLSELVGRNRDVFAVDLSELSTTDIAEHFIDTGTQLSNITAIYHHLLQKQRLKSLRTSC